MNSMNSKTICVFACVALAAMSACRAAPVEQSEQDDFTDEPNNEFDEGPSSGRSGLQREPSELSGYNGLGADFSALQAEQYPVAPAASSPTFGANHPLGENNMSTDDDTDADEGESSEIEATSNPAAPLAAASGRGARAAEREAADSAGQQEAELRQWSKDEGARGASEHGDADANANTDAELDSDAQDSNIANARIRLTAHDMATAAGHHHHHGHGVHGWLEMGAKTGKKGAFKWHDKHPVGGKGRR